MNFAWLVNALCYLLIIRVMGWAWLDRYNHFHFDVSPSVNRNLCIAMTVLLMLYSITGLIQFYGITDPKVDYFRFAYYAWIVIGVIILLRFRDRPFLATGMYMMVLGVDRMITEICVVSWDVSGGITLEVIGGYFNVFLATWMVISGLLWIKGRIWSRYPTIVMTALFFIMDLPILWYLIENFITLMGGDTLVYVFTQLEIDMMYIVLIALLLCNDNPGEQS